jgi:hypothetical protein
MFSYTFLFPIHRALVVGVEYKKGIAVLVPSIFANDIDNP